MERQINFKPNYHNNCTLILYIFQFQDCVVGYYKEVDECEPCQEGTYGYKDTDKNTCKKCAAGTSSVAGGDGEDACSKLIFSLFPYTFYFTYK